jgi:hypothetical protein
MRQSKGNAMVAVPSPETLPAAGFVHRSSPSLSITHTVGSGPACRSKGVGVGAVCRVHLASVGQFEFWF